MNMYITTLLMMSILISSSSGEENQSIKNNATYRVLVDQYHGFYAVYQIYNVTSASAVLYENRTFNMSKGDTVIWSNEGVPDIKLTITSKEELWDKYHGELRWSYKQFIHTFNTSGIYEIYFKEYPRFRQKIIVGPLEDTNITNKTINRTNITRPNSTVNNVDRTKTNTSINNSVNPVKAPLEKKPGSEAIVLITITSLLIYVFDRKIK